MIATGASAPPSDQPPASRAAPPSGPGRPAWVGAIACAALTGLCFAGALGNGFVVSWDDGSFIVTNTLIRRLDGAALLAAFTDFSVHYWAPFTWLSFAVDYRLWGLDPVGFHLTSVLLHALNAGLVYLLALALLGTPAVGLAGRARRWGAALAALGWSLHPLRVEAVAWATERKTVLSMAFALLAALAYLRHVRAGRPFWRSPWYLATLAAGLACFFSKPALVTLPLVLVILDAWPLRRAGRGLAPRELAEKVPLLAAGLAVTLLTMSSHTGLGFSLEERPVSTRVLVALRAVWEYLRLSLWPAGLSPFYLHPGKVGPGDLGHLLPALLVVAICVAAATWARRRPALAAAWFAALVAVAPGLASTDVSATAMADRFTYFPAIPLTLLAAGAAARAAQGWSGRLALGGGAGAAALLAALAGLSLAQVGVWRDDVTLWSRPIEVSPTRSGRVYTERATALAARGELPGAIADMGQAILIAAAKGYQSMPDLYRRRAGYRVGAGDPAGAVEDLDRALRYPGWPLRADALLERAELHRLLGHPDLAAADERMAAEERAR